MYLYIIIIWNIIVMLIYGIDKLKAKTKSCRISEATLISIAFLFGGFGALLGMKIFNHKTSKALFKISIPLALMFNVLLIFLLYKHLPI